MSSGLVLIHQAPSSLLPHIEWTIAGVSQDPSEMFWSESDQKPSTFRARASFRGASGSGAILAAAFMNLKQITFEVIQDADKSGTGSRWSFTPSLGMFHCTTDEAGNLLVNENQIRRAMEIAGSNALKLQAELRKLIGQAFDDELENYRELVGGAESNHGIVTAKAERVAYSQNVRPL